MTDLLGEPIDPIEEEDDHWHDHKKQAVVHDRSPNRYIYTRNSPFDLGPSVKNLFGEGFVDQCGEDLLKTHPISTIFPAGAPDRPEADRNLFHHEAPFAT